jgi:hypothetical protein
MRGGEKREREGDDERTSPHLDFARFWLRLKKRKKIF